MSETNTGSTQNEPTQEGTIQEPTNTGTDRGTQDGFTPITSQARLDEIFASRAHRIENKYKDDLANATERADKAEAELKKLRGEKQMNEWREQVEKETGVSASLLRGNTLKELKEHAELIKAAYNTSSPVVPGDGKQASEPKEDARKTLAQELFGQ